MNQLSVGLNTFFWNIFNRPQLKDWLDILLVTFLIYKLLMLTRDTRANQVFKGFLTLMAVSWLTGSLGFTALSWLVGNVLQSGAIVLVILFQPELRRALEHLGRGARIDRFQTTMDENQRITYEITQCLLGLSKRRVGALIVFERNTGLKDFIDTGTEIDSMISGALLVNIFEPNTPLHDGAVIIRGTRVVAAACVLSLSEQSNLSRDLGTRHRAGLGVSETTDATVLIVSEETGIISMAQGGKLTRHLDQESLTRILSSMYNSTTPGIKDLLANVKGWYNKRKAKTDEPSKS